MKRFLNNFGIIVLIIVFAGMVMGIAETRVGYQYDFWPNVDGTLDLGTSSKEWQDAHIDGTAYLDAVSLAGTITPETTNVPDLGSSSKQFKDGYFDGKLYTDAIDFNGTAISSTAAELNILDDVTADKDEINLLDGSVAGTAVASKALSLGTNKNVDTLVIADGGLYLGSGAGTSVSSTATELNMVDGSTAGTAVASKALVLGTNKNTDTLVIADGGLYLGSGAGTSVSSTATELNMLDGSTAGTAVASKALVLSTNKNVDTLVIADGGLYLGSGAGTSVSSTAAELNMIDGSTAGTVVASKAVVVDGSKQVNEWTVTGATTVAAVTLSAETTVSGNHDIVLADDTTGGNAGAKKQIEGLPKIKMLTLSTMTNGSTETTSYMDDTPGGEWGPEGGTADPTDTEGATYYKIGSKSLKLAWLDAAVDGDGVKATLVEDDLEANESIGFWFRTDTALTAAWLELVLTDDGGARTYNFPEVATTDTWTWIEINISDLAAGTGDAVTEVKILISAAGASGLGDFNCWVDGMWKWDADDEESLGADIVQDGVLSVMTVLDGQGSANRMLLLTENTDYFIHYQSTDALVIITDQSTYAGIALIAYTD